MDENKTKERLLDELAAMHQRIAELEMSESERKRVEQALAHERDLLRALMDNIPDTIYFKDTASRFTRINRAQAQVLGVSDSREAIGKTDFDFFTSEHARDAYADEQEIVKSGQPLIDKVERIRRANGQARWVSATKVPITDEEGRVVGTVGISRDITERRQAEEALRESEENFRALAENANDGIMIAVGRGAHVYANKRMAEITGYSVAELLKTTMMDLVHPNDLQKVMERYRNLLPDNMKLPSSEKMDRACPWR
jgi:PAS domain S-box-containing protein